MLLFFRLVFSHQLRRQKFLSVDTPCANPKQKRPVSQRIFGSHNHSVHKFVCNRFAHNRAFAWELDVDRITVFFLQITAVSIVRKCVRSGLTVRLCSRCAPKMLVSEFVLSLWYTVNKILSVSGVIHTSNVLI